MNVLITGASGFVAPYLAKELIPSGHRIFLTSPQPLTLRIANKTLKSVVSDLRRNRDILRLLNRVKPNAVVHLAANSSGGVSTKEASQLIDINVNASKTLYQALVEQRRRATFLFVSSGYVYSAGPSQIDRCHEFSLTNPSTPYGASKLAAEWVLRTCESKDVKLYIVRPFNHTGPGQQESFVCPALARRVIAAQQNGEIEVGNLKSKRDFCDVRDIVRAYRLILEKKPRSTCFVLGSEKLVEIREILDQFIILSGKNLRLVKKTVLMRKNDPAYFVADARLAKRELGWTCRIPFQQTIRDLYDYELKRQGFS